MAKFSVIKRSDIPAAAKQSGRLTARMREYDRYLDGLKANEGGKLVPDEGETPRGIALRISRAAKRKGRSVETRIVDGAVLFTVE